ncbi:AsnC family transcriptional regulator [Arthrobacter sp. MYb211]|uniref:Lrp/AsnC family transcriptional regulator n=1 Tax=unclassified Arthrobacter TaxID=235627 RepID=UPI000CFAFBE8|nr:MULTISPECIES: Lrp/AsnC family transcriptional regulator [unclassified Arthrobacter]PRA11939.1 AsnC family transcriptional regulator [Arthrobacter sp. MYb221]PRC08296.1 AsnC family transcriptional regulator [Arthrobacter sp. MYb211]
MSGSAWASSGPAQSNSVQVDETDLAILVELHKDARLANNILAQRVGLAPSTCLGRVKALWTRGIIEGYHARINEKLLGVTVHAMISVVVAAQARDRMLPAAKNLADLPQVRDVFVLGGTPDLLVRVATRSIDELRTFVASHLGANNAFSSTQTNIIFEHLH